DDVPGVVSLDSIASAISYTFFNHVVADAKATSTSTTAEVAIKSLLVEAGWPSSLTETEIFDNGPLFCGQRVGILPEEAEEEDGLYKMNSIRDSREFSHVVAEGTVLSYDTERRLYSGVIWNSEIRNIPADRLCAFYPKTLGARYCLHEFPQNPKAVFVEGCSGSANASLCNGVFSPIIVMMKKNDYKT
ncbi:unnamed protein product, partial [Amoebophrya sp. A25]